MANRSTARLADPATDGGARPGRGGMPVRPIGRRPAAVASLPPTATKVRVPELLVGILLVAGCALAVLVWHQSSVSTRQALVLAHPVSRGQLLTEADFAAADVSATGMVLVAYDDRARMVGRIAATDLAAATPLTDSVALVSTPLPAGEALVGRRLEPGEYPSGLTVGDQVDVVIVGDQPMIAGEGEAPAAGTDPSSTGTALLAVVEAIETSTTSDDIVVDLRLAESVAGRIAAAPSVKLVRVER